MEKVGEDEERQADSRIFDCCLDKHGTSTLSDAFNRMNRLNSIKVKACSTIRERTFCSTTPGIQWAFPTWQSDLVKALFHKQPRREMEDFA